MQVPPGIAEWFSRGVAVSLMILLPGLIGGWADSRLGTAWLTPLGFLVGMLAGSAGLIVLLSRKPAGADSNGLAERGGASAAGRAERKKNDD